MRLLCTRRDDHSRAEVYRCTRIIARRTYIHELERGTFTIRVVRAITAVMHR